jgi:hypothetical protein
VVRLNPFVSLGMQKAPVSNCALVVQHTIPFLR